MNNTTDAHNKLVAANDEIARTLIPAMVYLALLMLLGTVGNLLVCFVFFFRLRMTTQNYLIVALAVFDLLSCFIAMPTEIVDMRYFLMFDNEFACRLLRFIIHFCAFASILTLIVIAVDRYLKVCHPLQRQMSLKNGKGALLAVLLVALLFATPATILYGIRTTEVEDVPIPGHDCSSNDSVKDTLFPLVYNSVLFLAFFIILITLTVIYFRIWREMKRHKLYMARNSIPGGSRFYLPTVSETYSGHEPPPRSGGGRPSLPSENGNDDVFVKSERRRRHAEDDRDKRTGWAESDSTGSERSTACKHPSFHSDTTFCETELVGKEWTQAEQVVVEASATANSELQSTQDAKRRFQQEQGGTNSSASHLTVPDSRKTNGMLTSVLSSEETLHVVSEMGGEGPSITLNPCSPCGPPSSVDVNDFMKDNKDVCDPGLQGQLCEVTNKDNCVEDSGVDDDSDLTLTSTKLDSDLTLASTKFDSDLTLASTMFDSGLTLASTVFDSDLTLASTNIDIGHTDHANTLTQNEHTCTSEKDRSGEEILKHNCNTNMDAMKDSGTDGMAETQTTSAPKICSRSDDRTCVSANNTTFTQSLSLGTAEINEGHAIPSNHQDIGTTANTVDVEDSDQNGHATSIPGEGSGSNPLTITDPDLAVPRLRVTKSRSVSEVKSQKATVIALSITVVFFLSFVPHLSLITVRSIDTQFDRHLKGADLVLYNIFLRSYFINSVTNPFIYGVLNARFRMECLHVIRQVISCRKRFP